MSYISISFIINCQVTAQGIQRTVFEVRGPGEFKSPYIGVTCFWKPGRDPLPIDEPPPKVGRRSRPSDVLNGLCFPSKYADSLKDPILVLG